MSDTLFEIEDLDAYYGQAQVLEGVSLRWAPRASR